MGSRPLGRRQFLGGVGKVAAAAGVGVSFTPQLLARIRAAARERADASDEEVARDEDYWRPIQEAYTTDRALLNLNNGGVSPSPLKVQQALFRYWEFANQSPTQNMWRVLEPRKETVRTRLARLFGADREEIAIVRNTTEALHAATFGIELQPGDEVLSTDQDYPRMVNSWRQRELREGIVYKQIPIPTPPDDLAQIVAAFEAAVTPRTRVLHFCHVVNLTGQILPVRELCRRARERGILTIVDGAHAFAHFEFDGTELGCDFYGTSLHKWLSAPFGTGLLYVRRELIAPTWPLFAHDDPRSPDIRKFEQMGTHPCPIFLAIAEAANFHETIGAGRKEARLRYLRDFWARPLAEEPNVRLHTSLAPEQSCGLATVEIEGIEPGPLAQWLLSEHRIVVTPIQHRDFQGIRVTPHVYTTPPELERFVAAMLVAARQGIEAG